MCYGRRSVWLWPAPLLVPPMEAVCPVFRVVFHPPTPSPRSLPGSYAAGCRAGLQAGLPEYLLAFLNKIAVRMFLQSAAVHPRAVRRRHESDPCMRWRTKTTQTHRARGAANSARARAAAACIPCGMTMLHLRHAADPLAQARSYHLVKTNGREGCVLWPKEPVDGSRQFPG